MLQGAERRFVRSSALLEAAWETSVLGVGESHKLSQPWWYDVSLHLLTPVMS